MGDDRSYFLGVDGGGTSCRAALALPDGTVIGRSKAGAANIRTDLTGARSNIIEAAQMAFADAGVDQALLDRTPAVLGLAGANVGAYARQLKELLPFAEMLIETDSLIALEGAVGSGDGAMAILGTGTAYLSRAGEVVRSVGGWGFLIGDQGSGARIGRDLLEQTLLAHDGVRPASPLTQAILETYGNDPRAIVEFTTHAKPGDFGGFAPKVFSHAVRGDAVAVQIIDRATRAINASLDALRLRGDAPLCLLGGMAEQFAQLIAPRYRAALRNPLQDALGGATSLAVRTFGNGARTDD